MRLLGSSELKTLELPDQLQFVSGYESGWIDFMAPPAATFIVFLWAMNNHRNAVAWGAVLAYLALVFWWLGNGITRLSVSTNDLIAVDRFGPTYTARRHVRTAELKSLKYFAGGPNEPAGLYAYHGSTRTCLLPRLTEREANAIVETVHGKFPYIEHSQLAEISALHEEANVDFQPRVSSLEFDPLEDLRHWQASKTRELEIENRLSWANRIAKEKQQAQGDGNGAVQRRDFESN